MFEALTEQKNLHVVMADENNSIKMGRSHQCQIKIGDISVSRIHAQIKFVDNKFYISDYNSKFGTLVKLEEDLDLQDGTQLQCGRSLYTFNLSGNTPKSAAYL